MSSLSTTIDRHRQTSTDNETDTLPVTVGGVHRVLVVPHELHAVVDVRRGHPAARRGCEDPAGVVVPRPGVDADRGGAVGGDVAAEFLQVLRRAGPGVARLGGVQEAAEAGHGKLGGVRVPCVRAVASWRGERGEGVCGGGEKEKKKKKKKKKKKPGRRTSLGGMLGKSVGVGGKKMNSMRKTVADKGHLTEVYEATEKATKAVVDATKLTEVMGASQEAAHFLGDKTGVNAIIDAAAELGHVVGDATGLSDVTDGLRIGLSDGLDPDALPQRSPKGKKELKRQVRVLSICQTNPKPTNPTGWPD